jgi:hypothetical protein
MAIVAIRSPLWGSVNLAITPGAESKAALLRLDAREGGGGSSRGVKVTGEAPLRGVVIVSLASAEGGPFNLGGMGAP